jgi:hypothetical protein
MYPCNGSWRLASVAKIVATKNSLLRLDVTLNHLIPRVDFVSDVTAADSPSTGFVTCRVNCSDKSQNTLVRRPINAARRPKSKESLQLAASAYL